MPVLRINTDDFLEDYEFSLEISSDGQLGGSISDRHGRRFDFADTAVGWYRKPDFDEMRVKADAEHAELVVSEVRSFIDALCALPNIHWINQPEAVVASRSKPAQLLLAHQLGFSVPGTIITNSGEDAARFAREADGRVIVKSIYSASVQHDGVDFSCTTERVDCAAIEANRDAISLCPTQFQNEIDKLYEVRVTVVGDEAFFCRIDSQQQSSTEVDWRVDPDACSYAQVDVPPWVQDGCIELVNRSGLDYGAVDLIYASDGKYYFLENNPAGQYLWLEIDTGAGITDALIRLFRRRLDELEEG